LSTVSIENQGDVAVATLDRPPANAFDPEFVAALRASLRGLSGARALVLLSANPRLFSAGWDLRVLSAFGRSDMEAFVADYCGLVRDIFAFPAPVLAALPGHAIAGGLIVAAAADERLAADGPGTLGLSEVALGVPIPSACYEVFRHVMGERGAERLAAAGDNVSVARALEMGLVDRVVAAADLSGAALARARELAGRASAAYAEIKRRARAPALARFDSAAGDGAFLDFWFAPEARRRIQALVERLTKKA